MITCSFLPRKDTYDFCPVGKIPPEVMGLFPIRTLSEWWCLVVFLQCPHSRNAPFLRFFFGPALPPHWFPHQRVVWIFDMNLSFLKITLWPRRFQRSGAGGHFQGDGVGAEGRKPDSGEFWCFSTQPQSREQLGCSRMPRLNKEELISPFWGNVKTHFWRFFRKPLLGRDF